jgi:inner membrane protein involved in colicin E2 resistance
MVSGGVYSAGLIVLTALAEHTGTGIAFAVAGAFSVFGALCYLPAWRAERTTGRA